MITEFKVPELGENVTEGQVVNVLVRAGDQVREGQGVLELETDKAVVELPSPAAGKVAEVHVKPGGRVKVVDRILSIEAGATAAAPERAAAQPKAQAPAARTSRTSAPQAPAVPSAPPPPTPETPKPAFAAPPPATPAAPEPTPPAGPATRRLARELGVRLDEVAGSATGGRITPEDVKSHVNRRMESPGGGAGPGAPPPLPDFRQWGEIERKPLSQLRRAIAQSMALSWAQVPRVTHFDEADITELEASRRRWVERHADAPKVTMTVLALKAAVAALKAFPEVNASLDLAAGELVVKKYLHIGVAVDTEHGLIVPVIRNVDAKPVPQLAAELEALAARTRQRKIELSELKGGTFTITNLGGIGGTNFTPIVNYPEVAILALSRSKETPVWRDGRVEPRLMLPLGLAYDHRAVDGAVAARFLRFVAEALSDPFRLLLGA